MVSASCLPVFLGPEPVDHAEGVVGSLMLAVAFRSDFSYQTRQRLALAPQCVDLTFKRCALRLELIQYSRTVGGRREYIHPCIPYVRWCRAVLPPTLGGKLLLRHDNDGRRADAV
jgi:hypothetical protein